MFKIFVRILVLLKLTDIISAYRLSRDVRPQHYSLKLRPDMEENTFEGVVTITLYINTIKDEITLHSSHILNITKVLINQQPGEVSKEEDEKISVRFLQGGAFQPGEHIVYFEYNGELQERFGLLKASYDYKDRSGYLVVNEFEPTNARKAFPCFDEPFFKANFNIRLVTPNDSYIAVSNMPQIARYPTSNGVIYSFATTVKMSTYLISLAITDYQYYEDILEYENLTIPIRVYTYNASKENNHYAMEAAKTAIKFYSDYTGIDYPLPKLDMIEYNKGRIAATETWGLIQFKEGLLTNSLRVYDPWQSYLVIFHELAHFWFGNLVTNDWWNDLWLQEGFATFMSQKLLSKQDKESAYLGKINLAELFRVEETVGTLQLVHYLKTSDYVEKRFDGVVYSKGSFLLVSLEAVVGEQTFQECLKTFLRTFAYGTATTNNLISVFESHVLDVNIRSFLESYIYQTGFPIVNVDDSSGNYVLTQIEGDRSGKKWTIPISYSCGNNTTNLIWFDKDVDSVTVTCPEDSSYVLFNCENLSGIYAVNYTEKLWGNFIDNLNELPKSELDHLFRNLGVLYSSKYINCNIILQLLDSMKSDQENLISNVLVDIAKNIACFQEEYKIFQEYMTQKFDVMDDFLEEFNKTCTDEGNRTLDDADQNVRECAQWIGTNLVNFIKP